jgi:hypothetical protein
MLMRDRSALQAKLQQRLGNQPVATNVMHYQQAIPQPAVMSHFGGGSFHFRSLVRGAAAPASLFLYVGCWLPCFFVGAWVERQLQGPLRLIPCSRARSTIDSDGISSTSKLHTSELHTARHPDPDSKRVPGDVVDNQPVSANQSYDPGFPPRGNKSPPNPARFQRRFTHPCAA